eukprot:scaffold121620_cov69-Phaeocystis_antarctica.AAC.2
MASRRTARPQPSALSTRRPPARRAGPAAPRFRGSALPGARVARALDAAPVHRRHLQLDALGAHRVLLAVVVHIRRQPGAAEASEAQRHGRRRALSVGSVLGGGGGSGRRDGSLGSLALRLQRVERLANLPGARSQVRLLRPQLGEQRLGAEVGISDAQSTHGLEEGVGRAGFAHASLGARCNNARSPSGSRGAFEPCLRV